MGMFDNDLGTPFSERFQEREVFTLEDIKVGPNINTEYGEGRPALLKIGGEWFSIFGTAIVNQARNMEADDLPARVAVVRRPTKSGRDMKMIVPESEVSTDIPF